MGEPLASSLEVKKFTDRQTALVAMCMEVARMAENIAGVNWELAVLNAAHPNSDEGFVDYVGRLAHKRMEMLGDILNGMDAVMAEDEERSKPIFEMARKNFPLQANEVSGSPPTQEANK